MLTLGSGQALWTKFVKMAWLFFSLSTAQAEISCNAFESHTCPRSLSRHIGTAGCLKNLEEVAS